MNGHCTSECKRPDTALTGKASQLSIAMIEGAIYVITEGVVLKTHDHVITLAEKWRQAARNF